MNTPTYFNYWGKAKKPIEVDFYLSNGSDEQIAERYGITLQQLQERATKWGWKKVKPGTKYSTYHLLPYHSLDVAAVASVWWESSPAIQYKLIHHNDSFSQEQMKSLVLFFIALHDYGKLDIRFQLKAPRAWRALNPNPQIKSLELPNERSCKTYDHGRAGLHWYNQDQMHEDEPDNNADWMSFLTETVEIDSNKLSWIKAVTGHHGFVYSKENMPTTADCALSGAVSKTLSAQDKNARLAWIEDLEQIFLRPVGLSFADDFPPPSPLLAGFCSISDWLGSRSDEENFPYCEEQTLDLKDYFEDKCQHDAQRVFELSGIGGSSKPYLGVQALLKENHHPRQLQTQVDNLPDEPGLTIVEASTGSGKTEMALAYAWRLIENQQADSIIFALPTQATSNAIFERLIHLATLLFDENPNLLLAHGNARFKKEFIQLKNRAKTVQEEEAWAQCNEWLAQSRKRIFLGQIGICTIDQVLVSVLPVKHRFIRGFGVGRSVLIVDEVHAYDAYMYGLLGEVLRQQHKAGSSSILLSATLPSELKNDLFATYGVETKKIDHKDHSPYPLISYCDGTSILPFRLPEAQMPLARTVNIELHEDIDLLPDEQLFQRILSAAEHGAQVVIICNLVDVAQTLAKKFQERRNQRQLDIEVDIFHARYCLKDRQVKEEHVVNQFGPKGSRNKGRILVATQVIEQSLDVDFDWLITQLCPIDLLFQRMGRLHRHEKHDAARPDPCKKPLCTILLPPGTDFGAHGVIYSNTRVMWRTAQKLRGCTENAIAFPDAYRDWIEPIYQEVAWGNEPAEIEAGFDKFEIDMSISRSLAREMLKWAKDAALNDNDEKVRAVTRDGEFNLSVVPFLQTLRGKRLLNGDTYEMLDEWQQAEALSMSAVGVPKSWGNKRNKLLPVADEQGYIWLAMQDDGDIWRITRNNTELSYHPEWGMEKST